MRKGILKEISRLEEENCETCTRLEGISKSGDEAIRYCINQCEIGADLKKLGDALSQGTNQKVKEILAKGEDMTTKEFSYLRDKGVTRVKIDESMKEVEELTKKNTVERLTEQGKTPKEIQEETGISLQTIYKYRTDYSRAKRERENKVSNVEVVAVESTKELVEVKKKLKELQQENEKLEARNELLKMQVEDLKGGNYKEKHDLLLKYLALNLNPE